MSEVVLVEAPRELSSRLTVDADGPASEIDWDRALAAELLDARFGHAGPGPLEERVRARLTAGEAERKSKYGNGPFLQVEAEGSMDDEQMGPGERYAAFDVCRLKGPTKQRLREEWAPKIERIITSVALTFNRVVVSERVGDSFTFFRPDGKPVHAYTMSGSASPVVVGRYGAGDAGQVRGWYDALTARGELERVASLLSSSLGEPSDRLRAFLSGWAALEIMVAKAFKLYHGFVLGSAEEGRLSAAYRRVYDPELSSLKGRAPLLYKFDVVAAHLAAGDAEADHATFLKVKRVRDRFFHGEDVRDAALPLEAVRELLRRYLRLHLASGPITPPPSTPPKKDPPQTGR